jgi:hypothetical protein
LLIKPTAGLCEFRTHLSFWAGSAIFKSAGAGVRIVNLCANKAQQASSHNKIKGIFFEGAVQAGGKLFRKQDTEKNIFMIEIDLFPSNNLVFIIKAGFNGLICRCGGLFVMSCKTTGGSLCPRLLRQVVGPVHQSR